MHARSIVRLITASAVTSALLIMAGTSISSAQTLEQLSQTVWREDAELFGGFSALEVREGGTRMVALSDRGNAAFAMLERDERGVLIGARLERIVRLKRPSGGPLRRYFDDSEGLTRSEDGLYVSFEGIDRVALYPELTARPRPRPRYPAFEAFSVNGGLEALATLGDGTLLALTEAETPADKTHQAFLWDGDNWSQPFSLPGDGIFKPVGADLGPDGRLYVLERAFSLLSGFRVRIRSFEVTPAGFEDEHMLLIGGPNAYDNAEGIDLWQTADGETRLTLISDDNFNLLQRTLISEFRLMP
jgi:hypothetical protein